jgi:hypothetical protein
MGAPPLYLQKGGRCTPAGIPCLYLASDAETAISEVRPWKGARLSVAALLLGVDARLADLRGIGPAPPSVSTENADEANKQRILGQIAAMLVLKRSFARPGHEDTDLDYVPTQFVAGVFKADGFDGIIYSSLMRVSGHNVALFDPDIAAVQSVEVYEVKDVNYWSSRIEPNKTIDGD